MFKLSVSHIRACARHEQITFVRLRQISGNRRLFSQGQPEENIQQSDDRFTNAEDNSTQHTGKSEENFSDSKTPLSPECRAALDRIIRVDHSGELAADRIYAGQMAVLGKSPVGPVIQHMWDEEKAHLAKFEALIPEQRVRPSLLVPFWSAAGYALGAGTALIGKEGAMACTVAVESVITDHYNSQLREIVKMPEYQTNPEVRELAATITKFRDEEMEHHDTGLDHDAELAPQYRLLSGVIKTGCRGAVWLAERL